MNDKTGKKQYIVPYLMSSHPGSTISEAIDLALYLKKHDIRPEQVQDFYPTPGTAATTMYYTGLDPFTGEPVHVTRDYEEKRMQRALLQATRPENFEFVKKAIKLSGREDAKTLLPRSAFAYEERSPKNADGKAKNGNGKSGKTLPKQTDRRQTDKKPSGRNKGIGVGKKNDRNAAKPSRGGTVSRDSGTRNTRSRKGR